MLNSCFYNLFVKVKFNRLKMSHKLAQDGRSSSFTGSSSQTHFGVAKGYNRNKAENRTGKKSMN